MSIHADTLEAMLAQRRQQMAEAVEKMASQYRTKAEAEAQRRTETSDRISADWQRQISKFKNLPECNPDD